MSTRLSPGQRHEALRYLSEHDAPCPRCNYNLRGVAQLTCPECGADVGTVMALRVHAHAHPHAHPHAHAAGKSDDQTPIPGLPPLTRHDIPGPRRAARFTIRVLTLCGESLGVLVIAGACGGTLALALRLLGGSRPPALVWAIVAAGLAAVAGHAALWRWKAKAREWDPVRPAEWWRTGAAWLWAPAAVGAWLLAGL